MNRTYSRSCAVLLALLVTSSCASGGTAADPAGRDTGDAPAPRIVQAGAPGEASREIRDTPIDSIEGASWTEADVRFMQGMIHHHAQALRMTAMVQERTDDEAFQQMALRMRISQTDEIAIMQSWLRARGLAVPDVGAHHGTLMSMPGMLSDEQMQTLDEARGDDFERYFLQFMIQHHGGALVMVNELFDTPGAGQESTINFFANEVDSDQTIEIRRMQQMLRALG